jgi:GTPase SAR1 family protein
MVKGLLLQCCVESELLKEQERINREIEKQLSKDRFQSNNEIKLLLLGTAESGKSTYIKQMRIIHGCGYSESDKRNYTRIILQNIFLAMQTLVEAMGPLPIQYIKSSSHDNAKLIQSIDVNGAISPDGRVMDAIKQLWNDESVQNCYKQQQEYHISDSIKYFLTNIDRLSQQDYIPTEQDILRCRVPTSGIIEYSFDIHKHHFRMVDVGGQQTERRKWIHCFENVTSVIFMAALSDYNERHRTTENGQNRMDVSIALFNVIRNNPWFQNSSMMLFLNKKDLLEDKITTSHLEDYFPQYTGPKCDAISARKFILEQFCETESTNPNSKTYSHFTCATDTDSMRVVFEVVKDTILEQNISDYFY